MLATNKIQMMRGVAPRQTHHRAVAPRRSSVVVSAGNSEPAVEKQFIDKYPAWDSIYQQLNFKYGLQSILADDAAIMIDEGKAILLDVRLAEDHPKSHPKGSVSCPAFRVIKTSDGFGVGRMMKGLLMMANGVTPTEGNPDFPAMAAAAAGTDKIVILACEAGGSVAATSSFPTGKASRSLKAAFKLLHTDTLPVERVMHLNGGVLGWYNAGLRMEGEEEYDTSRAGRTPNGVENK